MTNIYVACDAAAKNNNKKTVPTEASWGIISLNPLVRKHGYLGDTTNQVGEIIAACKAIHEFSDRENICINVISDSKYVVETMKGNWRKKTNHDYWKILDNLSTLIKKNKSKIKWIHLSEYKVKSHDLDFTKVFERKKFKAGARLNRLSDILANRAVAKRRLAAI